MQRRIVRYSIQRVGGGIRRGAPASRSENAPFYSCDHVTVHRTALHDSERIGAAGLDHAAVVREYPDALDLEHGSEIVTGGSTTSGRLWHDHPKRRIRFLETTPEHETVSMRR